MAARKPFDPLIQFFQRGFADFNPAWRIVLWWEVRRIPYNLIVGCAGVISGIIAITAAGMSESKGGEPVGMPDGLFLLVAPILFGLAANLCYTGGWIVEIVLGQLLQRDLRKFANRTYVFGVVFSVMVAFLPAAFAILYLRGLIARGL